MPPIQPNWPLRLLKVLLVFFSINVVAMWVVAIWQYDQIRQLKNVFGINPKTDTTATPSSLQPLDKKVSSLEQQLQTIQNLLAQLESKISASSSSTANTVSASPMMAQAPASPTPSLTPVTSAKTTTPVIVAATKPTESLLFMGSGSTTGRDWTTIPGAAATVDLARYGQIQAIYFEASLGIVSGEAQARLMYKPTGGVLYSSTVSGNSNPAAWHISPAFGLLTGSGEYVVQVRSSNGELARLEGARIRIMSR